MGWKWVVRWVKNWLGSGLYECCEVQLAACSWLCPSEMNLLQNLHRTPHILLWAFCAHRHPQQNESKPLHAGNPSLLHSHTLTFRSVFTNSGEQDAAFWDLQASPHGSQGWAGTHLLSLMVEHPSSTVMPAVDGSRMGQHCWTLLTLARDSFALRRTWMFWGGVTKLFSELWLSAVGSSSTRVSRQPWGVCCTCTTARKSPLHKGYKGCPP